MWDFKVNVWNILIAIVGSGITAYLLSKFVVGKKVDRVLSFWEEEDRQKTKKAITDLSWLKFALEGEKKKELEINTDMRFKIFTLQEKYEDYLNLNENPMLGSELLRRIDRALSLIKKHGYHKGRKYMLKELQEKNSKDSTNPSPRENQS